MDYISGMTNSEELDTAILQLAQNIDRTGNMEAVAILKELDRLAALASDRNSRHTYANLKSILQIVARDLDPRIEAK